MCRIAGQVSLYTSAEEKRSLINTMCLAMKHGGPDGEGIFLSDKNSICFGHRRLALIDLSADAAQPMQDITGNYTITFNGEIYNYPSLKKELQAFGYRFKNRSDTEVILIAYAHWGENAFSKFNGMFVFALFDKHLQKVFLVRDSSGMKPLYYRTWNKELLFASEIRAFREAGIQQENPGWQILFLAFGFVPEPETVLEQVFMLPKGSFLSWNINTATYQITAFISASPQEKITDEQEAIQLIQQKLNNAINRHLIADAPVGVFLSGGIDSSIIALQASAVKGSGLHSLSVAFKDTAYDESQFQQEIARKIGSNHHQLLLKAGDFNDCFADALAAMDQPSADGINTWFVTGLAKKHGLKAVLSGLGGDELFGGYPSFNRISTLQNLNKFLPANALKLFQKSPIEAYQKLAYLSLRSDLGYYLALRGYFVPQQIAGILNLSVKEVWDKIGQLAYPSFSKSDTRLFAAHLEQDLYMKNQLLRDTDVMSMQHGVEIRLPFLDSDFLTAVERISSDVRFDKKLPKGLLIRSYQNVLPQAIWNRRKMGFSFPLQKWLKHHPIKTALKVNKNKTVSSFARRFIQNKTHWSKLIAMHLATK